MRIVLFGCGAKATAVLQKLIELKEDVVGVVYGKTDEHEAIRYRPVQAFAYDGIYCNSTITKEALESLKPDVIFVVGWRYKISKEQYLIPLKGTIVFHDSLLPKYRGFAPMNWAIINGETKMGATMFYIADEIDSGDIIDQVEIPIGIDVDAKTLEQSLSNCYIFLLEQNLANIRMGCTHPEKQKHKQATYTCKRIPADGLIDWNKTSMQIYNLIRGLTDPYPGAFTYLHDNKTPRKLYIWKASLDTECRNYIGRVPGRVVDIIKGKGVRVLTGFGTLIINEVGFEFGGTMPAEELIKSIKTTLGGLDK